MSAANEPQPPPIPADGDVWAELIALYEKDEIPGPLLALMRDRRRFGIAKYGTPLQRGNGRDHRADLMQELLDALAYAQAAAPGSALRQLIEVTLLLASLDPATAERGARQVLERGIP